MARPDKTPHLRPALAATVGVVCTLAVLAVALLIDGPSGQAVAETPAVTVPDHAHSGDLGVPGLSERELREFETATLGAPHAREHALMRAAMRDEDAADVKDATPSALAAAAVEVGPPAEDGAWNTTKTAFPITAIHAALLRTGKVMFFTYPAGENYAEAYLWDPATGQIVKKNPPDLNGKPANIWCAGQTFTADGELVVFGGNLEFPSNGGTWKGLNRVYTFDPTPGRETWVEQPAMRKGRWYPTGVRRPDGRIPIISGFDQTGTGAINPDVEVFGPPPAPGGQGTVSYVGDLGGTGPPIGDLYPRMISMKSGRTLIAGPDKLSTWFFTGFTSNSYTWQNAPDFPSGQNRTWGTTVPLPSGPDGPSRVMALGGADWSGVPSTTTTSVFDENANGGQGSWTDPGHDNVYGRGHANTVLLPDGSMVEVGGGRGSSAGFDPSFPSELHYALPEHKHVELWDPDTGEWRLGPAQSESRAYHSTALLLPDGSVMSAGDEFNGDGQSVDTAEIYKPPYFFRGTRPTITSAPATIGFGSSFSVQTPDVDIDRAALVAPGAVTHGVDMNQRMLELDVDQRTGCVNVTAPANINAAPPGYYMLFLVDDQGVPSVAKFVRLTSGVSNVTCGTDPPVDQGPPLVSLDAPTGGTVSGTIELKATATDDIGIVGGVQFTRSGSGNTNLGTDPSPDYGVEWNTTSVPNGTYTLTATARDAVNAPVSDSVTVTVANTQAPTANLTAPPNGATVKGTVGLTATASDPDGTVNHVQFTVDGKNIGVADPSSPYGVSWPSTNVPNGTHTLAAIAYDNTGVASAPSERTVTVDNPPAPPEDGLPDYKPPSQTPGGGTPGGGTPGGGSPTSPSNAAPGVARLRVSPARFRKGKLTTISFRLSETARVGLSFERKLSGRRVRGRCAKPSRQARTNCTRYVRAKPKLTVQGKAGANALRFRGRGLSVGRYRLTLLATDPSGKRSKPMRGTLQVLESAASARARSSALAWF